MCGHRGPHVCWTLHVLCWKFTGTGRNSWRLKCCCPKPCRAQIHRGKSTQQVSLNGTARRVTSPTGRPSDPASAAQTRPPRTRLSVFADHGAPDFNARFRGSRSKALYQKVIVMATNKKAKSLVAERKPAARHTFSGTQGISASAKKLRCFLFGIWSRSHLF